MKLTNKTPVLSAVFLAVSICFFSEISFSQTSSKGNWTDLDKEKARNEMEKARADIDEFIGSENTDFIISCVLDKVELQYNNFDEADIDQDGIQMITAECLQQVNANNSENQTAPFITEKGWTEADLNELRASFELQRNQLNSTLGEESVDDFIDCIMWKIENNFENMNDAAANLDKVSGYSSDLSVIFIQESKSTKGDWTEIDEIKARIALEKNASNWIDLIGQEQTTVLISNIVSDLEQNFQNFELAEYSAAAYKSAQEKELKELLASGISSKGNWNEEDVQMMKEDLELIREAVEANIGKEKFTKLSECILETMEAQYPNAEEALEDETGLEKLGEDCFNAIN